MGCLKCLFMCFTYIYTKVCFNFKKMGMCIMRCLYSCPCDACIPTCGPSMCSKPVKIQKATLNKKRFTNKTRLIINWVWDEDVGGVNVDDIKMPGNPLKIAYLKKDDLSTSKCMEIDFKSKKVNGKNILFNEIVMV